MDNAELQYVILYELNENVIDLLCRKYYMIREDIRQEGRYLTSMLDSDSRNRINPEWFLFWLESDKPTIGIKTMPELCITGSCKSPLSCLLYLLKGSTINDPGGGGKSKMNLFFPRHRLSNFFPFLRETFPNFFFLEKAFPMFSWKRPFKIFWFLLEKGLEIFLFFFSITSAPLPQDD